MKKVLLGICMIVALTLAGCSTEQKVTEQSKTIESLETKMSILDSEVSSSEKKQFTEAEVAEITGGKIKVPEPTLKTKEQVEAEFKAAGLTPEFVPADFGNAEENAGYCNRLLDQPALTYYSYDEVGDFVGDYAEPGATVIVGYFEKSE